MAGKSAANKRAAEQEQNERIAQLEAQQTPAPAPAPAAPAPAAPAPGGATDVVGELTKLKGLLDAGVLTQEEFDAAKAKVLAS